MTDMKIGEFDKAGRKYLGITIVLFDRSYNKVGFLYDMGNNFYRLEQSYTIRNWGTKHGIGEIALGGPTKETVLDRDGDVRFHELKVIHFMECTQEIWIQTMKDLLVTDIHES